MPLLKNMKLGSDIDLKVFSGRISKVEKEAFETKLIENPSDIDTLLRKADSEDLPFVYNLFWVLKGVSEESPKLLKIHVYSILKIMGLFEKNDGIQRNGTAMLSNINIPEEYLSQCYGLCFGKLTNSSRSIAERVFSMTACFNIAIFYPELLEELKLVLSEILEKEGHLSAGIRSRAKSVLVKVNRHLHK